MNRVTGLTLRGWFLDEAPLLAGNEEDNIKFITVMIERCSSFRKIRAIMMMTTNPQSGEDGLFYQTYIKGGFEKGILVLSFNLLDNPEFDQEDIEYYRKIFTQSQFERKVWGKWVRDLEKLVYPKYNPAIHDIDDKEIDKMKFVKMTVGLDEGQGDARAFVLTGFTNQYREVVHIDEYYHKNKENVEPKDVNDYVDDFIETCMEWINRFRKPLYLYADSSALYLIVLLKKAIQRSGLQIIVKSLNKTKVEKNEISAIHERTNMTNMMMGCGMLKVGSKCVQLKKAYSKTIKKDGVRIDDGKTNNIDILDASEYSVKSDIKILKELIIKRRTYGKY